MLVEFYAREVVAQQQLEEEAAAAAVSSSPSAASSANSHGEDVQMGGTRSRGDNRADASVEFGQTPTPP